MQGISKWMNMDFCKNNENTLSPNIFWPLTNFYNHQVLCNSHGNQKTTMTSSHSIYSQILVNLKGCRASAHEQRWMFGNLVKIHHLLIYSDHSPTSTTTKYFATAMVTRKPPWHHIIPHTAKFWKKLIGAGPHHMIKHWCLKISLKNLLS